MATPAWDDAESPPKSLEEALDQLAKTKKFLQMTQRTLDDTRQALQAARDGAPPASPRSRNDDKNIELSALRTSAESDLEETMIPSQPSASAHGGAEGDVSIESYFRASMFDLLKVRLPWLIGLLFLQGISAVILSSVATLLEKHFTVNLFIPMLVGTGGNAGNQPGVMVTRALALGNLPIRRLLWKEGGLSLVTSLILAVFAFFRVYLQYPEEILSAVVIALALFIVINIAIFLGIGFSLCLERMKCDPAAGSAPLLTTISDLIGITCLCLISLVVLR